MILGLVAKSARFRANVSSQAVGVRRRGGMDGRDLHRGQCPRRSTWWAIANPLALAVLVLALGCVETNAQPKKLSAEEIAQLREWQNIPGGGNWKFDEAVHRANIRGYRGRFDLWTRLDYERFLEAYRQINFDDTFGFIADGLFGTASDGDGAGDGGD